MTILHIYVYVFASETGNVPYRYFTVDLLGCFSAYSHMQCVFNNPY